MTLTILFLLGSLLLILTVAFILKVLLRAFCEFVYEKYHIAEETTMAVLYIAALGIVITTFCLFS